MSFQDDQVFLEKYLDENLNTVLGLRLAEKYISADNLEGAHLILSEFLDSHPNNATAKFLMGEIAFKEANNDKAKSHYEDTIQVDPTYVAAYHRLVTISNDDGDEAGVTEIYRLLNLVNPMDKKAVSALEGKDKADASKSILAERIQNKFLLSSAEESADSPGTDELIEETAEDVDSLEDELSSKLDVDDNTNLDEPLDQVQDESVIEKEDKESEDLETSVEDKDPDSEEDSESTDVDGFGVPVGKDESEAEASEEESSDSAEEEENPEEEVSSEEDSESTDVDAFGVPVGKDASEAAAPGEESSESVKEEEKPEEEVSEEDSKSTEDDAFGTEMSSEESSKDVEEPSEEDSSDADDTDIISEDIAPEDDSVNGDDDAPTEESSDGNIEPIEETDSEEVSEEKSSEESSEEHNGELDSETTLDSDKGESSDSADSSAEINLEKEVDENGPENSAESADESGLSLEASVVDKEGRDFKLPPFSKETLADVTESREEVITPEEESAVEGEAETDEEEIEEDIDANLDEGGESLDLPLDSAADAVSTEEIDSDEQSEDSDSGADEHNVPIDSIDKTDKGELDTPSDYESWVEKDATPGSMTTVVSDPNESRKNTFEELLSEADSSGEVDTMELPEESETGLTVEDEQDIQEDIDDIYSLAQIDDDDVSPLQAWFLERKTLQEEQEQDEQQVEDEENLETITEPKPVPFSGESEEEADTLQDTEENESEEKWDKFVETAVEKKGENDSKDRESASTDIDSELKNIFDEVASPADEHEIDESNADAPDITGGVKLNSDLATFTLADIYINQSQFNEALSVLDLLEQKGENLERVASMRDEVKVKVEARNK